MPIDPKISDGKTFVEQLLETEAGIVSGTNDTINDDRTSTQNQSTPTTDKSSQSTLNVFQTSRNSNETSAELPRKRVKRIHLFRPLFVYRQEQVERQRIFEQQAQRRKAASKTNNTILTSTENCKPCCCCHDHRRVRKTVEGLIQR